MATPTTVAAMLAEINATNLVDGQQLKQLLTDIVNFVDTSGPVPAATTTVVGGVLKAADVATVTGGTDTVTQAGVNAILVSLKAAGVMA